MAVLKTQKNDTSVKGFLQQVEDVKKRDDCFRLLEMMEKVTGEDAKMWGSAIIGFGDYHYKYASGREGDWFRVGFSPRKQNLTLYLMSGIAGNQDFLQKLGKHKVGKGCLYIKQLDDVDEAVLIQLIQKAYSNSGK